MRVSTEVAFKLRIPGDSRTWELKGSTDRTERLAITLLLEPSRDGPSEFALPDGSQENGEPRNLGWEGLSVIGTVEMGSRDSTTLFDQGVLDSSQSRLNLTKTRRPESKEHDERAGEAHDKCEDREGPDHWRPPIQD